MTTYADCVQERCATIGTGPLTVTGAVTGQRSFAAAAAADDNDFADGALTTIRIVAGSAWEVCDSVYTAPSTLSRGTLRSSSTGGRIALQGISKVGIVQASGDIVTGPLARWQAQDTWVFDWVNGSDTTGDGSEEAPLKTHAEYVRRTGQVSPPFANFYWVTSSPENITFDVRPMLEDGYAEPHFMGRFTAPLHTGTMSSVQQRVDASSQHCLFTDATAASIGASLVGKLVRLTAAGPETGYVAIITHHLGAGVFRLSFAPSAVYFGYPIGILANGDQYEVLDWAVRLTGNLRWYAPEAYVTPCFFDMGIGDHGSPSHRNAIGGGDWIFMACDVSAIDVIKGKATIFGSYSRHNRTNGQDGRITWENCMLSPEVPCEVGVISAGQSTMVGSQLHIGSYGGFDRKGGSVVAQVYDLAICDVANPVNLGLGAELNCAGPLWGTNVTGTAIRMGVNAKLTYPTGQKPSFTGQSVDIQMGSVDGVAVTKTFAQLPHAESTTGASARASS